MASYATGRPAPIGVRKRISIREFFSNSKRKKIGVSVIVVLAAIGVYLLFFVGAAPNNCSPTEGGGICDINLGVSGGAGVDSIITPGNEVAQLMAGSGWTNGSVVFRAPDFAQQGAKPVQRYIRDDISEHAFAVEGTDYYNILEASNANTSIPAQQRYRKEGFAGFYAWAPNDQKPAAAVPIYRICRGGWYQMNVWTDNEAFKNSVVAAGDYWCDGGVDFWAYPANYFPPQPASVATKDTDCVNQNLAIGDKGACVQTLKGILNGYVTQGSSTAELLDLNTNTLDEKTKNYTNLFVLSLTSKGVQVPAYSGTVTKEIWTALEAGYPTTGRASSGIDTSANLSACPAGSGNAEVGLKEYIDGVAAGKKYETDCHTFWLTYAKNKTATTTAKQTPATQSTPAQPAAPAAPVPPAVTCPAKLADMLKQKTRMNIACIMSLQNTLLQNGFKSVAVTGQWDRNTEESLITYIENLTALDTYNKAVQKCSTLRYKLRQLDTAKNKLVSNTNGGMALYQETTGWDPTKGDPSYTYSVLTTYHSYNTALWNYMQEYNTLKAYADDAECPTKYGMNDDVLNMISNSLYATKFVNLSNAQIAYLSALQTSGTKGQERGE